MLSDFPNLSSLASLQFQNLELHLPSHGARSFARNSNARRAGSEGRRRSMHRINGDIYLKPDRLRRWVPSHHDRVVLKDNGVFRTRRNDATTMEQVIAGIPGKPRYYVLDSRKLERLLRKKPSDT
jgi:hypothetical protein